MSRFLISSFVLLAAMSVTSHAARVKPAGVTASSYYPPESGVTYIPKNAMDGKLATSWIEGEEGSGLGSWIKFDVPAGTKLEGVRIWGGIWSSYDYWTRAPRPKQLEFKFADGSTELHDLTDKMEAQSIVFKKAHETSDVRIRIKAIYNGTTWNDAAISEIQLLDGGAEPHAEPKSFAYSSKLADDGDGNYKPENMLDGVADSMWCEGNQGGDGTDEWVEVNFGGTKSVSSMTLINGVGGDVGAWKKSNRTTKATLSFSDGSKEVVTLKNFFLPQTVSFPQKSTSKVRVTFTEVFKGSEYNDLCVSELYFK